MVIPSSTHLYEAFSYKLLQKLKTLDSTVSLPTKTSTGVDVDLFQKKVVSRFTEEKGSLPKRTISEIRFDDSKFWMEVSIVSHTPNNKFVEYFDSTTNKV
jgi:hypothetical protein